MKITKTKDGFNFKCNLPLWVVALITLIAFIAVSNLIDNLNK